MIDVVIYVGGVVAVGLGSSIVLAAKRRKPGADVDAFNYAMFGVMGALLWPLALLCAGAFGVGWLLVQGFLLAGEAIVERVTRTVETPDPLPNVPTRTYREVE